MGSRGTGVASFGSATVFKKFELNPDQLLNIQWLSLSKVESKVYISFEENCWPYLKYLVIVERSFYLYVLVAEISVQFKSNYVRIQQDCTTLQEIVHDYRTLAQHSE